MERAVSAGDWALIILAVFWAVLVLFLSLVSVNVFRVLESTKVLLDGVRTETVPLLGEVRTTVTGVNGQLDHIDTVMASAANISRSVERLTKIVEQTISSPLIKVAAFAYGASRAVRRFRGES
jgi:uncharacterized protein YoxC